MLVPYRTLGTVTILPVYVGTATDCPRLSARNRKLKSSCLAHKIADRLDEGRRKRRRKRQAMLSVVDRVDYSYDITYQSIRIAEHILPFTLLLLALS